MGLKPMKTWSLMTQALRIRFGVEKHEGLEQGQLNVKFMESLMVDESPKTSKEVPCCIMSKKNIEIKEKERVEEMERLVERSCNFDSISILSKESEHFEYSKEQESELENSERVKENECSIEKQESEKKSNELKNRRQRKEDKEGAWYLSGRLTNEPIC
ncbi:hypothetical protein M9H77_18185 [Catharanthus roseus]|uniref:Uncharacterized protein n=1 Tax=Catharanthus roseus TaxID=4058 RepID=A0ACC0B6X8_CATRO|nr:hypothetical protein M9H77_18185 [Catharanthus roseus]